jgi:monoamine oxidase
MAVTEAIIVGGGISGLYTAFKLQKENISYVLLEAKSIVGGRVEGKPALPHSDLSVDLGPTWFWPHQHNLRQLLTQLNIEWFEQYSKGENLYHVHPEELPSRTYSGASTMASYRVKGGMQQLVAALTEKLEQTSINTEHAAITIKNKKNIWQVTARHHGREKTFEAHQLVLALPPRLIIKHLAPEHCLSMKLINDLQVQQTWMSGQAKFVAVYNKPFWRENNLSGDAFSHVGPMVEIHDGSSTQDSGFALFGFIGLPLAVRTQFSNEQLKSQCITQLGVLFGPQALDIEASYLKDWAQDKWVATDQDSKESPKHAGFAIIKHQEELESLRLHLAASEFAQLEAGYLEGALLAADAAVHGVKSYSQEDSRYLP